MSAIQKSALLLKSMNSSDPRLLYYTFKFVYYNIWINNWIDVGNLESAW